MTLEETTHFPLFVKFSLTEGPPLLECLLHAHRDQRRWLGGCARPIFRAGPLLLGRNILRAKLFQLLRVFFALSSQPASQLCCLCKCCPGVCSGWQRRGSRGRASRNEADDKGEDTSQSIQSKLRVSFILRGRMRRGTTLKKGYTLA